MSCWTELLLALPKLGVQPIIPIWAYDSNVYWVRNRALQGSKLEGPAQKPFRGEIKYDFIMWIDSDQVFRVEHFATLLNTMRSRPDIHLLSGIYLQEYSDLTTQAITGEKFLSVGELDQLPDLVEGVHAGFGFMMTRYGLFESMRFPWFKQYALTDGDTGEEIGFCGEDVALCHRAREELGYSTWIATKVRVGHEKSTILEVGNRAQSFIIHQGLH